MASNAELQVERLSGEGDVREVLQFLSARVRAPHMVGLDLSQIGATRSQRVDTLWAEVLSNALLGDFGQLPIAVQLPETEAGLKFLARGGLLFALAQRAGAVEATRSKTSPEWASLGAWEGAWSPNDVTFRTRLFEDDPDNSPAELIQSEFVTFLNPHLAAQQEGLTEELTDGQVMPWAARIVQRIGHALDPDDQADLSVAIGDIATELILNLGHAFRRQPGPSGVIRAPRQKCYVQVYVTEGGGAESHNRLHLVVSDVGHGIMRTLRPKLGATDRSLRRVEPANLVELLLRNELPRFGRASGLGYRRIVAAVQSRGGSMQLTTGSTGADYDVEVVVATIEPSGLSVRESAALHFLGTTAHATIPIHPRPRAAT